MRVAAVIRHLHVRPVLSCVIKSSDAPEDIGEVDSWLVHKANEHIKDFTNKFVEFKNAEWYVDLMEI